MNKLQERRVFLGLTQPDVSRELRKVDPRMDVGMVSRFERGACLPTAAVLKRLTEVLNSFHPDISYHSFSNRATRYDVPVFHITL